MGSREAAEHPPSTRELDRDLKFQVFLGGPSAVQLCFAPGSSTSTATPAASLPWDGVAPLGAATPGPLFPGCPSTAGSRVEGGAVASLNNTAKWVTPV